jgi:hypothetical protein
MYAHICAEARVQWRHGIVERKRWGSAQPYFGGLKASLKRLAFSLL